MRILQTLGCVGVALAVSTAHAATFYTDGFDGDGNPAPTLNFPNVIGDFDDGTTQGWTGVRMPAVESVGGVLTNINTDGLGSDGNADSWVWLNTQPTPLFKVGELPGQYDIVQFDLRFDTLPPLPLDSSIRGRQFLQGPSLAQHGVTYAPNSSFPTDNNWRTYTVVRECNDTTCDSAWDEEINRVRIDIVDGFSNTSPVAPLLGTKFSIDNVILGRTTATAPFPAITPVQPNIVRNGDLSDRSNVSITGTNTGAFNINGGNGNYGPFRGNTGDVDHWTPYNNNPNSIVEAVADGGALDLLNIAGDTQGSFYLDTHYSTGAERFSLNSAGGYQNGLIQTDVLNGVTIDDSATYELAFDLDFNDARPANPNSNFKVALTVGTDSTDTGTAVAGSLFDQQLSSITAGDRQTLSISGAALKAAQDTGDPINLIVQSQANTSIVNFPGTPVPDNHVDSAVFTQVQVDNFSLIRTYIIPTGDVNKDGLVTQADVNLAQDYLDGNGGETAEKRQNDLFNAPSAPFEDEILASLNLTDFDLTGDDFFDADDVAAIAALVVDIAGDYDADGFVGQSDLDLVLLNWGDTAPPAPAGWVNEVPQGLIGQTSLDGVLLNWGNGTPPLSGTQTVPEPTSLMLITIALLATARLRR